MPCAFPTNVGQQGLERPPADRRLAYEEDSSAAEDDSAGMISGGMALLAARTYADEPATWPASKTLEEESSTIV